MANFYSFSDMSIQIFTKEWIKVVKQNYNHPSIITWVPINESWGFPELKSNKQQQNFLNSIYYLTKAIDNTRPVISNDGWEHTISDIITIHDYVQEGNLLSLTYNEKISEVLNNKREFNNHYLFANGYEYKGQPIIISEYGGTSIKSEKGWGYGEQAKDENDFIKKFEELTLAIQKMPMITGYCYTQLTDVQQEVNGLMDEDRKYKIDPSIIKNINAKISHH